MRKSKYISIILTMILCLSVLFFGCKGTDGTNNSGSENTQPKEQWVLNEQTLNLEIGDTFQLQTIGDDPQNLQWYSEDPAIVSVENGLITALSIGDCDILAKSDNLSMVCTVSVGIAYQSAPQLKLEHLEEENSVYSIRLLQGDEYEFIPYIFHDGNKITAEATLATENSEISINNNWIIAMQVVERAKVTITCQYEGQAYSVECFVCIDVLE